LNDLYIAPAERITFDDVVSFVVDAERVNAATESSTFEFKRQLSKSNVAEAVAALANADGGLVFVGVDEKGKGSDKVVGIASGDVDSVVNSLRTVLPGDAFPEVIVLAHSQKAGQVVVLLRVDADAVIPPVVVGGRVLVRYPGQSVAATREQITDLVRRASTATKPEGFGLPQMPLEGSGSALFVDTEAPFSFELRLIGSATLPYRVDRHPWLDTAAREAARTALAGSPLPIELWFEQAPPWGRAEMYWRENDARSTWVRLGSEAAPTARSERETRVGAAYVTLDGRLLRVLVGAGVRPQRVVGNAPVPPVSVSYDSLYRGLLGLLVAHAAVVNAVSEALGAGDPVRYGIRQAWLLPGEGLRISDVVSLDTFAPRGPGGSEQMLQFMPLLTDASLDNLDQLARTWVEIAMLDAGMRDFERPLRELPMPAWAASSLGGAAAT
jgi:hypothetical protein